jgi:hypothetical protein
MKTLKNELLHGVSHGANDKSNELIELPFTTIQG